MKFGLLFSQQVPPSSGISWREPYQDMLDCLPRAEDLPAFEFGSHPVPATTNPLGVKGCGEAGCTGALPAIMNAINDALDQRGAAPMDMPATPERVWRALQNTG